MNITALIASLVATGATPEMILAAVRSQEEDMAFKREANRQRQINKRNKSLNNNTHVTHTGTPVTVTVCDKDSPPSSPLLSSPTPPTYNPPLSPPSKTSDDDLRARVSEIFPELEEIINSPQPLHSSPIAKWLGWGADYLLDIRPSAQRWKEKNPAKAMNSLDWLSDDIARSMKIRTAPMPEFTGRGPPAGIDSHIEEQTKRMMEKYAEQPN